VAFWPFIFQSASPLESREGRPTNYYRRRVLGRLVSKWRR